MDISIIVATYRRNNLLKQTIESFCHLDTKNMEWEILIVDNANDSETNDLVEQYKNKLPIFYHIEVEKGKFNAINSILPKAKGKVFVFTDDDIIAEQDWLQEISLGVNRWPKHFVFGGKIIPKMPDGKLPIPKHHSFFKTAYGWAEWDMEEGIVSSGRVWGANMSIRAEIFHQGWRFNPSRGPNGENYVIGGETELIRRLHHSGFEAVYLPKSLVYHQILPEQLDMRWLYKRAFNSGRSLAFRKKENQTPTLFGAPRYLMIEAVKMYIKHLLCFYNNERHVNYGIEYWKLRGNIYQHKIGK